jgi:cytochrome c-type biogenesis protein CcmH
MTSQGIAGRRRRQQWWWWALLGLGAVVLVVAAAGAPPTSGVSDERLFALASQLKCQQCVGESVAGSQSPSAVQFRAEIQSQMATGRSDDEILNFFADRYGQEVLLTPPASGVGGLVWILPVVAVAAAGLALASTFRRWRSEQPTRRASAEDEALVAAALGEREGVGDDVDRGPGTTASTAESDR